MLCVRIGSTILKYSCHTESTLQLLCYQLCSLYKYSRFLKVVNRHMHHSLRRLAKKQEVRIVPVQWFENVEKKNKESFLVALGMFYEKSVQRRGHVEFIYAALKKMKEFDVERDLEAYKAVIEVFPKGVMIPTNLFQVEFMHYPKQQQCGIDILEQMEDNGVMPDKEVQTQLINIFGKDGFPVKKFARLMYWMPKFKNASPWALPNPISDDSFELAKLAVTQMSSVDLQSKVDIYDTNELPDALDQTWIVSAQAPTQQRLIDKHPDGEAVFVEGAFLLWLREQSVSYFILRAEPRPRQEEEEDDEDDVGDLRSPLKGDETRVIVPPSVHEQEDGVILALCATGTSSRDSLLSWIRFLERNNPRLLDIPVLFTFKSPLGTVMPIENDAVGKITPHTGHVANKEITDDR